MPLDPRDERLIEYHTKRARLNELFECLQYIDQISIATKEMTTVCRNIKYEKVRLRDQCLRMKNELGFGPIQGFCPIRVVDPVPAYYDFLDEIWEVYYKLKEARSRGPEYEAEFRRVHAGLIASAETERVRRMKC